MVIIYAKDEMAVARLDMVSLFSVDKIAWVNCGWKVSPFNLFDSTMEYTKTETKEEVQNWSIKKEFHGECIITSLPKGEVLCSFLF